MDHHVLAHGELDLLGEICAAGIARGHVERPGLPHQRNGQESLRQMGGKAPTLEREAFRQVSEGKTKGLSDALGQFLLPYACGVRRRRPGSPGIIQGLLG